MVNNNYKQQQDHHHNPGTCNNRYKYVGVEERSVADQLRFKN